MSNTSTSTPAELEILDRFYREGGLRAMASPHVHYDDPNCPHAGCSHPMEWIDFKLELHGDPEGVYKPLVRAWWEGRGFVGRCPACRNWIRFTTLGMEAIPEDRADRFLALPVNWHALAPIARSGAVDNHPAAWPSGTRRWLQEKRPMSREFSWKGPADRVGS